MTHPDPRVAEALERTARELAAATTPPPAEVAESADDAAAYLAWLRERPASKIAVASQRPRKPRAYLDRSEIPKTWPRTRERPAQPSPHPAPGAVPTRPDGYDAAVAVLRRLDDFGAASLEAARTAHPDWPYADLVVHAAAHQVVPEGTGTDRKETERAAPDAPTCETCGTLLDPDGCWTCSSSTTAKASA